MILEERQRFEKLKAKGLILERQALFSELRPNPYRFLGEVRSGARCTGRPCTSVAFYELVPPSIGIEDSWSKLSSILAPCCLNKTTINALRKPAKPFDHREVCELVDYPSIYSEAASRN
jgi:hypothetical protein